MHRFSLVITALAVLLVWIGAAVTSKDAGMAFSDWPLSNGSINPDGWLGVPHWFLEHGHRLIATLTGLCTLTLFGMAFVDGWKRFAELLGLVATFVVIVVLVNRGMYVAAATGGVACLSWLAYGWRERGWTLVQKLTALALLAVVFQALLGGLRVLHISDAFGIVHGCIGQAFFCLLVLINLATSKTWQEPPAIAPEKSVRKLRWLGGIFLGTVVVQLFFGASVRHLIRVAVPRDVLTTGGEVFPGFDGGALMFLFLHKTWALCVLAMAIALAANAIRDRAGLGNLWRLPAAIGVAVCVQVTLGIIVLISGTEFFVTGIHVLTGLSILVGAFAFFVQILRRVPHLGMIAGQGGLDRGADGGSLVGR